MSVQNNIRIVFPGRYVCIQTQIIKSQKCEANQQTTIIYLFNRNGPNTFITGSYKSGQEAVEGAARSGPNETPSRGSTIVRALCTPGANLRLQHFSPSTANDFQKVSVKSDFDNPCQFF